MRRLERRLRLATGLIIACFVVGHFLNHSLGVVSVDAMDRVRTVLAAWWRSPAGTVLLYGSLLTHFGLALVSLYRRTTLRMPLWEATQLLLGLAVPPLLIAHIVGTRFNWLLLGHNINYERLVGVMWSDPYAALRQAVLLLIVWTHFCFGIHYWLRLQRWYGQVQPALFAAALLIPSLALAGFAAAGNEIWPRIEGAGAWTMFRRITFPLLMPTTLFVLVNAVINSFRLIDHIVVMTHGGPDNSSSLLLYYIFEVGFKYWDSAYAATLTIVLLAILGTLALLQFLILERRVHYQ